MPRRPTFATDDVADAGLVLARRAGWAAVTTRAVAEELGVTPMSLYRVVADAGELRRLIADAAASPIQPGRHPGDLDDGLRAWALDAHRHLGDHPGLAAFVIPIWTELPRWLDIVEAFLARAAAEQATGPRAVARVNAVFAYVLARSQFRDDVSASRALAPLEIEPGRYPHIAANRGEFATAHVEPHFRIGLDALLRGLSGAQPQGWDANRSAQRD